MIEVKFCVSPNDEFLSVSIKGHAESGPYGHDLVCAAVSAIVTGICNAFEENDSFDIILESGNALIKLKEGELISSYDNVVINTLYTQIKTIEQSYGQYIQLKTIKQGD